MKKIEAWIPMSTEVIEDQREVFKAHMGMYPEEFDEWVAYQNRLGK